MCEGLGVNLEALEPEGNKLYSLKEELNKAHNPYEIEMEFLGKETELKRL